MKKIYIFAIIISAAAALCSCAAQTAASPEYDVKAVAEALSAGLTFDDGLAELSEEAAELKYGLGAEKICAYAGSGATPEVIIAAEFADEASASAARAKLEAFIADQKSIFSDYNTNQLPKLNDPLILISGRFAFCAVSAGSSADAEAIINNSAAAVSA